MEQNTTERVESLETVDLKDDDVNVEAQVEKHQETEEEKGPPVGYFFAGLGITLIFGPLSLFGICLNENMRKCDRRRRLYLYGMFFAYLIWAIIIWTLFIVYTIRQRHYM